MKELKHYGILGQKWGIRRYQTRDGRLTPFGKIRFKQVAANKSLQKFQSKKAITMLNKDKKKVDNLVYKYENKVNKYSGKNSKKETKYIKLRDSHAAMSKLMDKKINDIQSGTLKAGKDFIIKCKINKIPYVYIFFTGPRVRFMDLKSYQYIERKRELY